MKKIIHTDNAPKAIGPYSQAVDANGGMLFLSGQLPIDPSTGKFVEGGIKEQTEQVLKNLGAILQQAGCSYNNVVKVTCLLSTMEDFAAMNEVYTKYFTSEFPARAAYAIKQLPMNALVEMEAFAVK